MRYIVLILSLALFLLSFLVLFKAPTHFLWMLAVVVTGLPWLFALGSVLFGGLSLFAGKWKIACLLINVISFGLFLVPVWTAASFAGKLKEDMSSLFPVANGSKSVFQFGKLFSPAPKNIQTSDHGYKVVGKDELFLRVISSGSKMPAPCIVLIHGGSWQSGDKSELEEFSTVLAGREIRVVSIDYQLAPGAKCPEQVADVKDAISWLKRNADKFGIDTNQFVLMGRSAGGQIAALTAYSANIPGVKGLISFYAPNDMVWGAQQKTNKLVLDVDKVLGDYIGGLYNQVPELYEQSSPMHFVNQQSVPTLIIHGELDALVSYQHSVHLNEKLRSLHVPHYFLSLPAATHASDYFVNGPAGQLCIYAIEQFTKSVTAQ